MPFKLLRRFRFVPVRDTIQLSQALISVMLTLQFLLFLARNWRGGVFVESKRYNKRGSVSFGRAALTCTFKRAPPAISLDFNLPHLGFGRDEEGRTHSGGSTLGGGMHSW